MTRVPRPFVVFGFASTHDALAAEQLLLEAGIDAVPIPASKELGALCGIALRVPADEEEAARSCLFTGGVVASGLIRLDDV